MNLNKVNESNDKKGNVSQTSQRGRRMERFFFNSSTLVSINTYEKLIIVFLHYFNVAEFSYAITESKSSGIDVQLPVDNVLEVLLKFTKVLFIAFFLVFFSRCFVLLYRLVFILVRVVDRDNVCNK